MRLLLRFGLLPDQAEALTWGEALLLLEERERGRRESRQAAALIAWEQAALTARALLEGRLGEVYECFPFWTDEEVRELKVERIRSMLEGMGVRREEDEHAPVSLP